MSEFDRAQRVLNVIQIHNSPQNNAQNTLDRILISGESQCQPTLVNAFLQNKSCGRIVLTNNAEAYRGIPNAIVICNSVGSRNYHPFYGHSQTEIEDMLCGLIPLVHNPTDGLKMLVKAFSRMLTLDAALIDAIVNNHYRITNDLFEERADLLVQRGSLSRRDADDLCDMLRGYSTSYSALESMLSALTRMSANASGISGFRVTRSLKNILTSGGCVVFAFDGNLEAADQYDRTLLALLPTDLTCLCHCTQDFALVFDNLPWSYIEPFSWIIQKKVSCLMHLVDSVEYTRPGPAADCIGNRFTRYLIFRHSSDETCTYWSNFLGKGRFVEYSYSGGNTVTTRYPLSQAYNYLFGMEQHNEGVGYHYVDRNIYQSYDIKNQPDFVFMCFDKKNNHVFQNTLADLR